MFLKSFAMVWIGLEIISMVIAAIYMTLVMAATNIVTAVTGTPAPTSTPDGPPSIPVPFARDVIESAGWLSRQQISVWFAIVTILFGLVIYLIIKHLLTSIDSQRIAHKEEIKEMRGQFAMLQTEEKQLSLQLLQYLEKDHAQTIVLVKDNQTIMQETVQLLRAIQQERHDDKLLRDKNHDILQRLDPQSKPILPHNQST